MHDELFPLISISVRLLDSSLVTQRLSSPEAQVRRDRSIYSLLYVNDVELLSLKSPGLQHPMDGQTIFASA